VKSCSAELKVAYVCHAFGSDPTTHIRAIRKACRSLVASGFVPLAPQLFLSKFLDESTERRLALSLCITLVSRVDELHVFGEATEGMRLEIGEARRLGIPVVAGDARARKALTGDPPR